MIIPILLLVLVSLSSASVQVEEVGQVAGYGSQKREVEQGVCPVCQLVVTYVEQLIAQNSTIAEIEQQVDALCNMLPSPGNSLCVSLVATYLPQMIQWILNKENPQMFCQSVGLC